MLCFLSDKKKAINLLSTLVKNDSEHISAYLQLGNLLEMKIQIEL